MQPKQRLLLILASCILPLANLCAADPPFVTILTRDAEADESPWIGPSDWDQLGVFEVIRSGPTAADLRVFFAVSGTARRGDDYALLPGQQWFPCGCERVEINFKDNSITIPAGSSSILLGVRAWRDYRVEGPEVIEITLKHDQTGQIPATYTLAEPNRGTVRIRDESYRFHLWVFRRDADTLAFNLSEGSLVMGEWQLELSHDLRTWRRIGTFSPGNVAAFAESDLPKDDFRPRFYRAALVQPPESP